MVVLQCLWWKFILWGKKRESDQFYLEVGRDQERLEGKDNTQVDSLYGVKVGDTGEREGPYRQREIRPG